MQTSSDFVEQFKDRVVKLLAETDLSQDDIAKALGCSRSAVAQYKSKRTPLPLEYFPAFCELVGTTPEQLVGGSNSPVLKAYNDASPGIREAVDKLLFGNDVKFDPMLSLIRDLPSDKERELLYDFLMLLKDQRQKAAN